MTALVKYKNPVEYSFIQWIQNYPESTHWKDRERFLEFTKNICVYNAKKWKCREFLKKRILSVKPKFDRKRLTDLLITFEYLLDFHKIKALPRVWDLEAGVKSEADHYIERGVNNGKCYSKELPTKK